MNELITKYLTKESTAEENNALLDWVISSDENKQEFISYCQYWYDSVKSQESSAFDSNSAFEKFLNKKNTKQKIEFKATKKVSLWQKISAVAAVAIVTLGAFFLFNTQGKIETQSFANNSSAISQVLLPDGTVAYLHKGAAINFPSKFTGNTRNIEAKGHFYLEVAPDKSKPFIVNSNNISIQVLGTAFDVNSSENEFDVIVSHGKVKVSTQSNSVILEKGERADYNNKELVKSINKDVNFLSWQTGILLFESTRLKQVFADIERHYNCTIKVSSNKILSEEMTGTYQDYSLEDIMDIISTTFPQYNFTHEGSVYMISE